MIDPGFALNFKPLMGTEEATIDEKGRVLFNKKKRDRLGDNFVIAWSDIGCLEAYSERGWQQVIAEIIRADATNQGRQLYTRMKLGFAEDELKFDSQGRVVIPHKLRELGKLKDKIVLVGNLDRVDIWAKEEYDKFLEDPEGYGAERRDAINRAYMKMTGRE